MTRAIVLYSGGLDSTVLLSWALWGYEEVHPLAVYYGQRHTNELVCARDICESLGLSLRTVNIDASIWKQNALLHTDPETGRSPRGIRDGGIPTTFVPGRNLVFLSHAVAYAAMLGGGDVLFGATATDGTGFPDCSVHFVTQFRIAVNVAIPDPLVRVLAPFVQYTKRDVVQLGARMGVPFDATWSCYQPRHLKSGAAPCHRCDACVLRADALQHAAGAMGDTEVGHE